MNSTISIVPRVYMPGTVRDVDLNDVLDGIKTGVFMGDDLICITNTIVSIPDDNQRQVVKRQNLPVALFNGTFSYKNSSSIVGYSSFTAIDFDHIKTQADFSCLWSRLSITPCVYAVFKSVSGRGIKAIVMHDSVDYNMHEELYEQLLAKFYVEGVTDVLNIDLARGSYLCYDPHLFVNNRCAPFHFVHNPGYVSKPKQISTGNYNIGINTVRGILSTKNVVGRKSDESIIAILGSYWRKDPSRHKQGFRANSVFKSSSELCNAGVNIDKAVEYLVSEFQTTGLSESEIRYHAHRGYINNYQTYGLNRTRFDSYGRKRS